LKRIDGREDPPPPPSGPGEGFGAPKEGKKRAKGDFRGVKLSNETQPDPEALLARKSNAHPAQLSYRGHELMDNRHDLIVDCRVTRATNSGERDAAKEMTAELSIWPARDRLQPDPPGGNCPRRSLLRRSSP
jgi:hypothetical protein